MNATSKEKRTNCAIVVVEKIHLQENNALLNFYNGPIDDQKSIYSRVCDIDETTTNVHCDVKYDRERRKCFVRTICSINIANC